MIAATVTILCTLAAATAFTLTDATSVRARGPYALLPAALFTAAALAAAYGLT